MKGCALSSARAEFLVVFAFDSLHLDLVFLSLIGIPLLNHLFLSIYYYYISTFTYQYLYIDCQIIFIMVGTRNSSRSDVPRSHEGNSLSSCPDVLQSANAFVFLSLKTLISLKC